MTERHYDVVVLGRSLGALVTAALLARRDFRVLVVGQGARPPSYGFERHVLHRRAFTMLAGASPVWKRILSELAQTQAVRRRVEALDPMLSLLLPSQRIALSPDRALFSREMQRELPEVLRALDEVHAEIERLDGVVDAAFDRELSLPPGTFWERREAARVASLLSQARGEGPIDPFGELPVGHPYRVAIRALGQFGSDLAGDLPPLALARLYGSFTRSPFAFARGAQEIDELLQERIASHGGVLRLEDRASRLVLRGSTIHAVQIEGDLQPTGASFIVSDQTGQDLAELAQLETGLPREWPRIERAAGRFVMSVVVRTQGLPKPLGREILIVPTLGEGHPPLHVVRMDPAMVPEAPRESGLESLLVAEMLLPLTRPGPISLGEARSYVLRALCEQLPFLSRHLVAADSPHDGHPAWKWVDGRRVEVERIHLPGGSARAEAMQPKYAIPSGGWLGIGGEPLRGPLPRTFLVGSSVLPALGQEGQLIAASSVARIVTRADRHKARIRKAMWSRVEIG